MDLPSGIDYHSLLSSAQRWALRALLSYTDPMRSGDDDTTLLFSAISWEHLCKAYLYSLDPKSIFAGQSKFGQTLTITLKAAQSKIWALRGLKDEANGQRLDRLRMLADIRNGILHSASLDIEDQRSLFIEYLRSSEELHAECLDEEDPANAHLGDFSSLAAALIDEPQNLLRERVETKKLIAVWRRREIISTGLSADLGDEDYDMIVNDLIVNRLNGLGEKFANQTGSVVHDHCPVCNEDDVGAYNGTITERPDGGAILQVSEFLCGFCELHLSTVDEMRIAGVKLAIEIHFDD